jgi:hypothetical protein
MALVRAASAVIFLVLLHSSVDYPLRTMTISTLFAICCGLLIPPTRGDQAAPPTSESRQHTQRRANNVGNAERH